MAHITSLERGLKRLLGLCPDLTLDARQIQLIIDGKQNQVIAEHRGTYVEVIETTDTVQTGVAITTDDDSVEFTVDINDDNSTESTGKSFSEYFKKQED